MLQYPLSHIQKQVIIFINIEEIGLHINLVTESKVTECNRISLKIFTVKSMSQDEIKSQSLLSMCAPLSCLDTFQASLKHAVEKMSGIVLSIPSAEPSCDTGFCLTKAHTVTFCDF